MKTKLIILSAAFVFSTTGCEQKTDPANQQDKQKIENTAGPAKEGKKEPANAGKSHPQAVENSAKISTPIAKETTEQSLADISKHGREITKTQESKSRTRAQMAEDEMLKDLEKFK
jgi:hypothetical protein